MLLIFASVSAAKCRFKYTHWNCLADHSWACTN